MVAYAISSPASCFGGLAVIFDQTERLVEGPQGTEAAPKGAEWVGRADVRLGSAIRGRIAVSIARHHGDLGPKESKPPTLD